MVWARTDFAHPRAVDADACANMLQQAAAETARFRYANVMKSDVTLALSESRYSFFAVFMKSADLRQPWNVICSRALDKALDAYVRTFEAKRSNSQLKRLIRPEPFI